MMNNDNKIEVSDIKFLMFKNQLDNDPNGKYTANRVLFVKTGEVLCADKKIKGLYTPLLTGRDYENCEGDPEKLRESIDKNMQNILEKRSQNKNRYKSNVPQFTISLGTKTKPAEITQLGNLGIGFNNDIVGGEEIRLTYFPETNEDKIRKYDLHNKKIVISGDVSTAVSAMVSGPTAKVDADDLASLQDFFTRADSIYNCAADPNHAINFEQNQFEM